MPSRDFRHFETVAKRWTMVDREPWTAHTVHVHVYIESVVMNMQYSVRPFLNFISLVIGFLFANDRMK